ncbi:Orotate phosphoribosyltransferase [Andreprevotia sp. IGB-42]|uniref:ComF family protein n=1 Tax=Andreprevotia sp. IGB-42 TaxID=2497473 RepID=UPI00135B3E32|nr:ComF family protein [Andreprevotia sp. IGB-42]KAF0815450.1 Orotate phosphoribosyltransferase [Andreprevotia sp. IGB-42]
MNFLNKLQHWRNVATRTLALPASCLLCGCLCKRGLCAGCDADLPKLPAALCPRCALPTRDGGLCGGCLAAPPAFDASFAALSYAGVARQLIPAAKFGGRWHVLPLLADVLLHRLPVSPAVDAIVPLPLHPNRLKERGYNQATEIAVPLARAFHLPLRHDLLLRNRDTEHQARLTLAARQKNLRGAFTARPDAGGLRIALVDDVMTSGASLDAAARALKKAGAAHVEAWVLARAL